MCFSLICCGWMLLTSAFDFVNAAMNHTTTLFVNHGQSARINCNYSRTDDTELMAVNIQSSNYTLCSLRFNVSLWKQQNCRDYVKFNWIPETEEISFELLNLQIQDKNTYTCTVMRTIPPPHVNLGVTQVQVIVRPVLSLSCEKMLDGSSRILCSVAFHNDSLELLWIRDGEFINNSYSNKSFSHESYLILPPQINNTVYSCWVNHSSLNKPLIANLSSSACYEKEGVALLVTVVSVVLLTVFLMTALIICKSYRRAHKSSVSPVAVSVTSEPVLQDHLQSEVLYSTLGNHHPIPCSPIGVDPSRQ
ncbi:uncharacterized protein LOC130236428 [Danio aesculapii]|uniref:uncharacterized protein LOC130236428 n=1 Tax=Danio aesculapii TaxID=1142201 RepID=UPI0024C0582A|nr:uncharacterized protein LOC130236428 [Danio aesculapii]